VGWSTHTPAEHWRVVIVPPAHVPYVQLVPSTPHAVPIWGRLLGQPVVVGAWSQ